MVLGSSIKGLGVRGEGFRDYSLGIRIFGLGLMV